MLDNNQLKAVQTSSGPALIVAGPGSGKTKVLTHHIKYLIEEHNVLPRKILVITFSKAASLEMKTRFNQLKPNVSDVNFGTFHSVFFKFLKLFNHTNLKLCDDNTRSAIIRRIVDETDDIEYYSNRISFYKSRIDNSTIYDWDKMSSVIEDYNQILHNLGLMDYDDILIYTYEMIKENMDIQNTLKGYFDHILIDEFQDINEYQYEIVRLISNGNLFAVGDEDQSIYGFRGADGKIMKKISVDYPGLNIIQLNTNYRSDGSIVKAAETVISENKDRLKKTKAVAVKTSNINNVVIRECESKNDELSKLLEDLSRKDKMTKAVLVRTNSEVYKYSSYLKNDRNDIIKKYDTAIIDSYKHYLEYIIKGGSESLSKIINIPNRFIPRNIIVDISNLEDISKIVYGTKYSNDLKIFMKHINTLKKSVPFSFAIYMENVVGIKAYFMKEFDTLTDIEYEKIFERIKEQSRKSSSLTDFYNKLNILNPEIDILSPVNEEDIKIMTFHASKGLEFDLVYIPDVVEGKIPSYSFDESEIAEERRLFYVAMTRAKNGLYIYTNKKEENAGALPSRFINKLMNYSWSNSSSSSHSSNLSNTASNSSSSSIYNSSGSSLGSSGFSK